MQIIQLDNKRDDADFRNYYFPLLGGDVLHLFIVHIGHVLKLAASY